MAGSSGGGSGYDISASLSQSTSSSTGPIQFGNVTQGASSTGLSSMTIAIVAGALILIGALVYLFKKP